MEAFNEVCRNFTERRWEPSELNGGKLCEVVYTIVEGALQGAFPNKPSKPKDMVKSCRALEQTPEDKSRVGDRSLRILIPRMLVALYEIRNNRGVGHVGGDVNANFMDAVAVQSICRWVVAELIRVFHGVSTEEAQTAVDLLVERKLPIIWERDGIKRVLPKVSYDKQILVLLYSEADWVAVTNLLAWTEYSNPSKFRRDVLMKLHRARLVEYDAKLDRVCLTSAGVGDVENRLIPELGKEFF
ncbi:MAG: hypothetical protein KF847_18325 [Pirellulales bacterium]|nr:hypothetical protein [Pirellulales bacterium]